MKVLLISAANKVSERTTGPKDTKVNWW